MTKIRVGKYREMLAWKTRHGLTWINSRSRLQVYPSAIWILGLYPLPEKKLISVYSSLLLSSPANIQSPPPVTIATPMIVIIPTTRRLLGVATLQVEVDERDRDCHLVPCVFDGRSVVSDSLQFYSFFMFYDVDLEILQSKHNV
ncbi:hypothetical protein E3N88_41059 [Mikania micrantha]|uniref:Uncharacterized protein n=1 Tax=Mikania micrantha TaxID=192012 RepID=A0A5N6LPB9_9ASTR|nr:hypothetical protein E3N88_41059 [Mikania micrantha]